MENVGHAGLASAEACEDEMPDEPHQLGHSPYNPRTIISRLSRFVKGRSFGLTCYYRSGQGHDMRARCSMPRPGPASC